MADSRRYLDPRVVDRLGRLEVKARLIVEGFLQGSHRSPYRGASVEFAEHREYVPGDDLRHLDWKVFGRNDRYYVKQYEEETNLRCLIALDTSGSMRFPEGYDTTRWQYGTLVAAALSHLLIKQRDAAGIALFDTQVHHYVEPHTSPAHLQSLFATLDTGARPAETKTSLLPVLGDLADRVHRRSLIVVISDFFAPVADTLKGLARLRKRKHDVLLLQLLMPEELTFEFSRNTLYKFVGLEGSGELIVDPRAMRAEYLAAMDGFRKELRRGCLKEQVDFESIDTGTSLDIPLSAILARRARKELRR
ncbi:MAG: DUF58 domain-containing protein [Planctomycetes bacterium]|nr:DUF58 domain-containing protein [Planctomycetota bacterium]